MDILTKVKVESLHKSGAVQAGKPMTANGDDPAVLLRGYLLPVDGISEDIDPPALSVVTWNI